jgi:putative FmdB family regulatory protein
VPTYQYSCKDCGHSFDMVQSFSDDSLTVCPVCEGQLRKVYNAVGVVFKGSGFYRNDSRPKAGAESGATDGSKSSDSGSKSASETGSSTKSETKTETKSDTKSSGSSASAASTA